MPGIAENKEAKEKCRPKNKSPSVEESALKLHAAAFFVYHHAGDKW